VQLQLVWMVAGEYLLRISCLLGGFPPKSFMSMCPEYVNR
jgi:hypothetical protein